MTNLDLIPTSDPGRDRRPAKWLKDSKPKMSRAILAAQTPRDATTKTSTATKSKPWSIRFWMQP